MKTTDYFRCLPRANGFLMFAAVLFNMQIVWGGTTNDAALPLSQKVLGNWIGLSYGLSFPDQHNIEIKIVGTRLKAYDVMSLGLTDEQVAAAQQKRLRPGDIPFLSARVVSQEYDVTIKDDQITLVGKKAEFKFKGSRINPGKWNLDTFTGSYRTPGVIVGKSMDTEKNESAFCFTRKTGYDHSEPTDLAKGQVHNMTCTYDNQYHFTLYIPKSYDPAKPAPLLVNDNPDGNAAPLSPKMAEETGWIMVGLKESSNRANWMTLAGNSHMAILDVRRILNINPMRYYFSGFSGGSRRSSFRGIIYAENCAGVICIGAGHTQWTGGELQGTYMIPPIKVSIFFIVGKTDMNNVEVCDTVFPMAKKEKRVCKLVVHPGGHSWGRDEDREAAIRWLEEQRKAK